MHINIGYAVSNQYTAMLSVSILSLLENSNPDDEFNIYILNSDITDENKRKINELKNIKNFNIEYITVENKDFEDIATGISIVSNYRVKIASLKPELDKILFLDSDLLIVASLQDLYNTNLKDNYFGAVVDPGIKLQYEYTIRDNEKFPDRRFNTGVMLINLDKWRKDNIENKLLEGMKWYSTKYKVWSEQNVLNMVCKNHILELPLQYNVCPILQQQELYQEEGMWEKACNNPQIIHICGKPKYWEIEGLQWEDIFWSYARKTPYYEYFLHNLTNNTIKNNNNHIKKELSALARNFEIQNNENAKQIENLKLHFNKSLNYALNYRENAIRYWRYRLLCNITFGKKKKHYIHKKYIWKNIVEEGKRIRNANFN